MINEEKVFSFVNWKSPHIAVPSCLLVLVGGFFIFIGLYGNNSVGIYIGGSLIVLFFGVWYFLFSIKIKMSRIGLEYSSVSKTVFINWNDIKTFSGYLATQHANLETDMGNIHKISLQGQKFLFVSTEENAHVEWGQKISNKLIYFHFRPELIELISSHLKSHK
jgi:hypothetical protein